MRPQGRRPAFRWKDNLAGSMLNQQYQQLTTHQQRQQHCMEKNFDDVFLDRVELIQFILCLQFAEEKLCLPSTAVNRR